MNIRIYGQIYLFKGESRQHGAFLHLIPQESRNESRLELVCFACWVTRPSQYSNNILICFFTIHH